MRFSSVRSAVLLASAPALLGSLLDAQALGIVEAQSKLDGAGLGLASNDRFASSVADVGDVDGDGVGDLAVGAPGDDDGGSGQGAVYLLFLDPGGAVRSVQKISAGEGGFAGSLENQDLFGISVAGLGDLDQDGVPDIAAGAIGDDDGGSKSGAVWILFLNADGTVKAERKISETMGGFTGGVDNVEHFGISLGGLGDVDLDGVSDLAVGAVIDATTGAKQGGFYVLFLNPNGTVKAFQEVSSTGGGFGGELDNVDEFGAAVAGLGDLDGDGVPDVAVGAPGDDDGGAKTGSVWVLFLNQDGTVKGHQRIGVSNGNFSGPLSAGDRFGAALARLDELDPDDSVDLAVGAPGDAGGGNQRGAVWVLFLHQDGTVEDFTKTGDAQGGFTGALASGDELGSAVAALGDVDGNGVRDLVTGAPGDGAGGPGTGAAWMLLLREGSAVPFLGSGVNPEILQPGTQVPGIGKSWDPIVVPPADGKSIFHFLGASRHSEGVFFSPADSGVQELLISLAPGDLIFVVTAAPGSPFDVFVPDNPMLIGFPVFTQGGILKSTGELVLSNRLDVVLGL